MYILSYICIIPKAEVRMVSDRCQRQIQKNVVTTGLHVRKKYVKKADTVKEVFL